MGITVGSQVHYGGDLPEGVERNGIVVDIEPDDSGDNIATVQFGTEWFQDIPVSELEPDPLRSGLEDDA